MSTIITTEFRVHNARNFVDLYNSSPSIANRLYVAIGRGIANPWIDDALPPAPVDMPDEITNFWLYMNGAQKVATTEIALAVPRIDWTAGIEYDLFDPTSVTAYADSFYVVNSEFRVYQVASKTGAGIITVTEPLGTNGGAPINTGDGYTWQYLYDISLSDSLNLVNSDWIVVNWGDNESIEQAAVGDVNAYLTLGAKYVLVKAKLLDTGLPTGIEYRQVGIVSNPLLNDGVTLATATIVSKADLTIESGQTVHIENRTPITRNPGQSEDIKLVVQF